MIERNLHPLGRINNIHFGLCQLGDGLVRVFSLGFLHTRLPINQTRNATKRMFEQMKLRRQHDQEDS